MITLNIILFLFNTVCAFMNYKYKNYLTAMGCSFASGLILAVMLYSNL